MTMENTNEKSKNNTLTRITTAVRNSRTAKVAAIVAAIGAVTWIALLVGFVGASKRTAKTKEAHTLKLPTSTVRPKLSQHRQHFRAAARRMPENATVSSTVTPCASQPVTNNERPTSLLVSPTPAEDEARNAQRRNTLPVDSSEHQDRHYEDRSRTTTPIERYPRPAVVWVSAAVSPYARSIQTIMRPVQGVDVSISSTAQRKSEPGFRPFEKQVESGQQTAGAGFQPFRR